jgi:hypothetical protein
VVLIKYTKLMKVGRDVRFEDAEFTIVSAAGADCFEETLGKRQEAVEICMPPHY